jgi:hypothetical protein
MIMRIVKRLETIMSRSTTERVRVRRLTIAAKSGSRLH